MVRVDSATGTTPLAPTDTMEVWVDDIRLTDVVDETGFAGQFGVSIALGDLGTFRIAATRRDPNFRQLGESPSFAMNNDLAIATTVRLDQFLPPASASRCRSRWRTRERRWIRPSSRSRTSSATRSRGSARRSLRPRPTRCPRIARRRSGAGGTPRS
jgi:hypothetical protein